MAIGAFGTGRASKFVIELKTPSDTSQLRECSALDIGERSTHPTCLLLHQFGVMPAAFTRARQREYGGDCAEGGRLTFPRGHAFRRDHGWRNRFGLF
jgi:hypothetical protein